MDYISLTLEGSKCKLNNEMMKKFMLDYGHRIFANQKGDGRCILFKKGGV